MVSKSQSIIHKISWFTVVGIVAAAVYVIASLVFDRVFMLRTQWATGLGVLVSAATSYFGHYYLTFQVQGHHRVHGTRFTIQLLATLVLNALFIQVAHDNFQVPLELATAAFAILMPVVNFVIYQIYTFHQSQTCR